MFSRCSLHSSPFCLPCVGVAALGTGLGWPKVARSLQHLPMVAPWFWRRDSRTHVSTSSFRSVASAAVCAPFCTAQEVHGPTAQPRDARCSRCPAPQLSRCFPWGAAAGAPTVGGPLPCWKKGSEGFSNFRWQMMLGFLLWDTPTLGQALWQRLLAAPPPPLLFQLHR